MACLWVWGIFDLANFLQERRKPGDPQNQNNSHSPSEAEVMEMREVDRFERNSRGKMNETWACIRWAVRGKEELRMTWVAFLQNEVSYWFGKRTGWGRKITVYGCGHSEFHRAKTSKRRLALVRISREGSELKWERLGHPHGNGPSSWKWYQTPLGWRRPPEVWERQRGWEHLGSSTWGTPNMQCQLEEGNPAIQQSRKIGEVLLHRSQMKRVIQEGGSDRHCATLCSRQERVLQNTQCLHDRSFVLSVGTVSMVWWGQKQDRSRMQRGRREMKV